MKPKIFSYARCLGAAIKRRICKGPDPQTLIMEFPSCVHIQSPSETLRVCKQLINEQIRGAYLRFGDGDVYLLTGRHEKYQQADVKLAFEMREAFNLYGAGIMKCLMLHSQQFGLWPSMKPGIHEVSDVYASELLSECYQYFIGTPIYSPIALAYCAVFDRLIAIDFLKFLKDQALIAFVGNQDVPESVLTQLFGKVARIPTPVRNSYLEIDRIEQDIRGVLDVHPEKFGVVIIAMGCAGRVLIKRIYNQGYNVFLFDFGSLLDAFCGWDTRTWIEICPTDVRDLLHEL